MWILKSVIVIHFVYTESKKVSVSILFLVESRGGKSAHILYLEIQTQKNTTIWTKNPALTQLLYSVKVIKYRFWMYVKYKSKKFPSEGHFYRPFLCKANWTLCHIYKMRRLFNFKVESVGFVRAVSKCTSQSQNVK